VTMADCQCRRESW